MSFFPNMLACTLLPPKRKRTREETGRKRRRITRRECARPRDFLASQIPHSFGCQGHIKEKRRKKEGKKTWAIMRCMRSLGLALAVLMVERE
eukprot:1807377-Rhodomonas_salina.1